MSPRFSYACVRSRGGCGQTFSATKSIPSRYNVVCPACQRYGRKPRKDGTRVIEIVPQHAPELHYRCNKCEKWFWQRPCFENPVDVSCPRCHTHGPEPWTAPTSQETRTAIEVIGRRAPYHTKDLDHQDGRTGDDIPMPAFGPDARISSRRQLGEHQKRAREILWNRTHGTHETLVTDPATGKKEKVTLESAGIDVGEIHTLDVKPEPFDHAGHAVDTAMAQIAEERRAR